MSSSSSDARTPLRDDPIWTVIVASLATLLVAAPAGLAGPAVDLAEEPVSPRADPPCIPARPADPGCESWSTRWDPSAGDDRARRIATSPDGSTVVTAGSVSGPSSGLDVGVLAHDATSGNRLWTAAWDGLEGLDDRALDVAVGPAGERVYVAGIGNGESNGIYNVVTPGHEGLSASDAILLAFDLGTGELAWATTWDGPASGPDGAMGLAIAPDGSQVYAAGFSKASQETGAYDLVTLAVDARSGELAWTASYDGPGPGNGWDGPVSMPWWFTAGPRPITVSPDGSVVLVTGRSSGGAASGSDFVTIAYRTQVPGSTGELAWSSTFLGEDFHAGGVAFPMAVAASPDGSQVFVTGVSEAPGPIWYDGYKVTGHGPQRFTTVAYDLASGQEQWVSYYEGVHKGMMVPMDLAVDPAGDTVFVTGVGVTPGPTGQANWVHGNDWDWDRATVAIEAETGEQRWADGSGPASKGIMAYGTAIETSPDGSRVYVASVEWWARTLYSGPAVLSSHVVTLAHEVDTGQVAWEARQPGAPNGLATNEDPDLATTTDRVFVSTSNDRWDGRGRSLVTVAYRTASTARGSLEVDGALLGEPDPGASGSFFAGPVVVQYTPGDACGLHTSPSLSYTTEDDEVPTGDSAGLLLLGGTKPVQDDGSYRWSVTGLDLDLYEITLMLREACPGGEQPPLTVTWLQRG